MTKQSFISSYKFQLRKNVLPPLLSVTVGVVFMLLMTGLMNYCFDGKFTLENGGFFLLDFLSGLMFFVYGIACCSIFLNTGAANGVSRTTTVIASMASFFTSAVINSAFISILSYIMSLIFGNTGELWALEFFYGMKRLYRFYGENPFVVRIRFFIMCTFLLFFFAAIGFAISSVYYKLSKRSSVILTVAAAVIFIFGYPVAQGYCLRKGIDLEAKLRPIFQGFCRLFGIAHVNGSQTGNCVQGVLMMLLFSAVFGLIAWLLVRRSGVKPAPIRGE